MDIHSSSHHFHRERKRWVMLILFSLNCIMNNLVWLTFGAITDRAALYYNQSAFAINSVSIAFMVTGLLLCVPGSAFIDKKGLLPSMQISSGLVFAGSWLRCVGYFFSTDIAFWWVLSGSVVVSFAQPPLLVGAPKLAVVWFGESERSVATSLASLSNLLGMGLAFLLGPLLISPGAQFERLYFVEACAATLIALLVFFFFRQEPESPPSATVHNTSEESFLQSLKQLRRQYNYILLTIVFGMGFGMFTALFTVLDQVVEPEGYGKSDTSLFGLVMIGSGIVGGTLAGLLLDKTRAYRAILLVLFFGSFFSLSFFFFSLYVPGFLPHTKGMLIASCALTGFFAIAILPVAMETSVEVSYPVGEATVTGLLMMVGNLTSAVITAAATSLQAPDDGSMLNAMELLVAIGGATLLGILFFRGPFKRYEYELTQAYEPVSS